MAGGRLLWTALRSASPPSVPLGLPFASNCVSLLSAVTFTLSRRSAPVSALTELQGGPQPGLLLYLPRGCPPALHQALRARAAHLRRADLDIEGLERLAPSDLALSLDWRVDQVWRWRGQAHINILEASALSRLFTAGMYCLTRLIPANNPMTALSPSWALPSGMRITSFLMLAGQVGGQLSPSAHLC